MDSTVIVALPATDDKVNKLSSEKVAHLTIAYLGETSSLENMEEIVLFVRHAASQLSPFGLEVDYRDTLGPDDADVLFFKKDSWSFPRISDFRAHLLKNDNIARAYASATQYPEWTPHLTMGYPETPAHEDEADYPGIHYVQFDRIAIWTGDSEGPEFRLKYEEHGMEAAMHSDISTAERGQAAVAELFHYGKKGMKWGVTTVDKAAKPTVLKEKKALRNAKDVTVTQRKAGTYVKAKGGKRQVASDDAVKAQAGRQKAKKSTTDSLTNDELRATIDRMRLEQEFSKLDKKVSRRGNSFVKNLLLSPEARSTTEDLLKRATASS